MLNNINISSAPNLLQLFRQQLSGTDLQPMLDALSNSTAANTQIPASNILSAMCLTNIHPGAMNQKAVDILKQPPFAPKDINMFTNQAYPNSTPMAPAADKPVDETQIKGQLTRTFAKRFHNSEQVRSGMAVYNDPDLASVVPDPRLRAAVASLKGTPGEATIDAVKNVYSQVQFQDLPLGVAAQVKPNPDGQGKPIIAMSTRYQNEDFRLLAPVLAHESMHQDPANSASEERINHSLDAIIYGKFALEDPSLARSGTELARRENTKLMARLNSRDADGNLRLFTAQGNVLPGGGPLDNFADAFVSADPNETSGTVADSSPGNPTMQKILKAVTGVDVQNPNFDAATEQIIDQHQAVFSPTQLVQLAKVLKLDVKPHT